MMRVLGLLGLVLALAIVASLIKRQLDATRAPIPATLPAPAGAPAGQSAPASVRDQSRQIQQQYQQALDAVLQQRAIPDEAQ
ncbi:MAG: hypothetical protein Q4F13_11590 [Pseudomonadota bacterium]|nr:hypothetical protein [Pseudomonadota bacterium]